MINKLLLVGRLGKEPQLEDAGQHKKLRISIATDHSFKDRDGNWKDETDWHNVTLWNKTAEYVAKVAEKGSVILVEGRMKTRKWEKDGATRYEYEISPDKVKVLNPKKSEGGRGQQAPPPGEDDLPF